MARGNDRGGGHIDDIHHSDCVKTLMVLLCITRKKVEKSRVVSVGGGGALRH